jgi:hypothetical protein
MNKSMRGSLFWESARRTYTILDVLDEKWRSSKVVDGAVEEAEALLGVEVDRDDVVVAALDHQLGQEFEGNVAAASHLGYNIQVAGLVENQNLKQSVMLSVF